MAIIQLIKKELVIELRRRSVIGGIALYLVSLVFICYLTFSLRNNRINEATWSALFWLVLLFACVNSVAKSFIGERKGHIIYLYSLASGKSIIVSKIVYNSLLCILVSFLGYLFFVTFISNPVQNFSVFAITIVLTSIGLATTLTLISGIAAKANNSYVVMAVLSFPVLIAQLLMAIKATKNSLDGLDFASSSEEMLNLGAINLIALSLAYLLFPYIWRS